MPYSSIFRAKNRPINPFPGFFLHDSMKSTTHTKSFELPHSIEEVFPLFSPEGEKLWVPGWDYDNLMGTTELYEDYVFLTQAHDHGTTKAIWLVKQYDPAAHFVQFYKIEPEDKIGVVTVECKELDAGRTRVKVTYKYLALSETGERFISGFDEKAYAEFIGEWQTLLLRYFEGRG